MLYDLGINRFSERLSFKLDYITVKYKSISGEICMLISRKESLKMSYDEFKEHIDKEMSNFENWESRKIRPFSLKEEDSKDGKILS